MADARFDNSPLMLPSLMLKPRAKVELQVGITTVFLLALFGAYRATDKILNATEWTGVQMPPDTDLPGWAMLVFPIIAIIPGVYIFLFLKYNFNY